MDSSSDPPEQAVEEVVETRNWLELPRDVTLTILMNLGLIEVMQKAQFVCKLWYQLCKDPAMWRIIDGENLGEIGYQAEYEKMALEAVDRSAGGLVVINVEYFGTDELLSHIAERANCLKCLHVRCCDRIRDDAMIEAVKKLPLLEEVEITHCSFSEDAIRAIGVGCPQLTSFKLNGIGTRDPAQIVNEHSLAIAESMAHVRHLQLIGSTMTNVGLEAILNGCPILESLDLRACFHVDLSGSLGKRCKLIKNLRLPYDPTNDYRFVPYRDYDSEFDNEYPYIIARISDDDYYELYDDDYYDLSCDSDLPDSDLFPSDYEMYLGDDDDV